MNREFVAQGAARARRLDRVHVAENVGNGHVRGRQFFDEAHFARQPRDGRGVSLFLNQIAARAAERRERIVMNFTTGDVGDFLVEKFDQSAQNAALCLAAQSEQNKIVPRQNRIGDLRQNRFFVPVNARKERLAGFELLENVGAKFVLHGAARCSRRKTGKFSQFAERCWFGRHRGPLIDFHYHYMPCRGILQISDHAGASPHLPALKAPAHVSPGQRPGLQNQSILVRPEGAQGIPSALSGRTTIPGHGSRGVAPSWHSSRRWRGNAAMFSSERSSEKRLMK